jgi:chemotaxis response regulator CheB
MKGIGYGNGSVIIVQNEDTAVISGMPKAAIKGNGIDVAAPLDQIAGEIVKALYSRGKGTNR